MTSERLGIGSLVGLAIAVVRGGWIMVETSGRYRHAGALRRRARDRGGRAALFLTATTAVIGGIELADLISTAP